MPTVLTLTPNPALDLSVRTAQVQAAHKLRCHSVLRHPGGGGINVARMLHRLGIEVQAHCLTGGVAGGQLAALLAQEGVRTRCQAIAGETRENLAVLDDSNGQEFRFVMPGPQIEAQEWQACLDAVQSLDPAPRWLVASGSLPPGVPDDFYARLARWAQGCGIALALDSSGPALAEAMEAGVALVKPSLRELRALTGAALSERHEAIAAAAALVQRGAAQTVALSLGGEGAVLVTARGVWQAPAIPVSAAQGTTGAGDCFLAALLAAMVRGDPPAQALRWGVAAGTASLLAPGTALAEPRQVLRLLDQVQVTALAGPAL